jgi:hypothetical protein
LTPWTYVGSIAQLQTRWRKRDAGEHCIWGGQPPVAVRDKIAIIIDDGLAIQTRPGTIHAGVPAIVFGQRIGAGEPGGSSVSTFYEMNVDGELYADGEAKVVFVDAAKQKPLRIPDNIRKLLA